VFYRRRLNAITKCLSVGCLSPTCIMSKWLNSSSNFRRCGFSTIKILVQLRNTDGHTQLVVYECGRMWKTEFSTKITLYLGKCTRYAIAIASRKSSTLIIAGHIIVVGCRSFIQLRYSSSDVGRSTDWLWLTDKASLVKWVSDAGARSLGHEQTCFCLGVNHLPVRMAPQIDKKRSAVASV